jgi:prepilin signal peptidase PulO-like enzyme (type II secretory pathway)
LASITNVVHNNSLTESKEMVTTIILGVFIGWCLFSLIKAYPWFFLQRRNSKQDISHGMFMGDIHLAGRIVMWLTVPFWLPIGIVAVLYERIRSL